VSIRAGDIDCGQHRGDHVVRMSASGKNVIAVEVARHHAVCKRRQLRQGTLSGTKYPRPARYLDARSKQACDAARFVVERPQRAAHGIDQAALTFVYHLGRQALILQRAGVVGDATDACVHVAHS
jgi:hypothetical protein